MNSKIAEAFERKRAEQSRMIRPQPEPRYDETYHQGVAALDRDGAADVDDESTPPDRRELILSLAAVLCDPKDNASHAGKPYQHDDAAVRTMAASIAVQGLIHPIEVRPLPEPIERDKSVNTSHGKVTHYTHRVVSGFKRFAALQKLGRETSTFSEVEMSDQRAIIRNGIENYVRNSPSDYETAIFLATTRQKLKISPAKLAANLHVKEAWVESLVRIAECLPVVLLDIFRLSPTPEVRRDLDKIAKIERESKEETHQAMIDAYAQLRAEREALSKTTENKRKLSGGQRTPQMLHRTKLMQLQHHVRHAEDWSDGCNRHPISDASRAYGLALLNYILDPNAYRNPIA